MTKSQKIEASTDLILIAIVGGAWVYSMYKTRKLTRTIDEGTKRIEQADDLMTNWYQPQ